MFRFENQNQKSKEKKNIDDDKIEKENWKTISFWRGKLRINIIIKMDGSIKIRNVSFFGKLERKFPRKNGSSLRFCFAIAWYLAYYSRDYYSKSFIRIQKAKK